MTLLLAVQIAAYLALAAVALHQHHRAGRTAARIEDYCLDAAKWEATTGGRAAYRDVAEVAAGGKGRWS